MVRPQSFRERLLLGAWMRLDFAQTRAQVAEWLMAADCKSATLRVTEVRILPCAPFFSGCNAGAARGRDARVDFAPSGNGRMVVALVVLAALAVAVGFTMEPGRLQKLTWILLGFFAFRVVLTRMRVR
jgi:hypothetical protein